MVWSIWSLQSYQHSTDRGKTAVRKGDMVICLNQKRLPEEYMKKKKHLEYHTFSVYLSPLSEDTQRLLPTSPIAPGETSCSQSDLMNGRSRTHLLFCYAKSLPSFVGGICS